MINKTEVEIQIVLDTENRLVVTSGVGLGVGNVVGDGRYQLLGVR